MKKRKKWPFVLGAILIVLIIVFAILWPLFYPQLGFGNLSDTISSSEISQARAKFTTGNYQDKETGLSVDYNIFIPDNYDESQSYPLMVYIADSGSVGDTVSDPLVRNFGGAVWATDSDQAKHPSFVVVPCYPEIVLADHDIYTMTDYVELTARMIKNIEEQYNIDRIYGTGQSMGAMTTMYLAANHPELYDAVLIVDGQWKIDELEGLKDVAFVYIAAGGDAKASSGQQEVKDMLSADGIAYGELINVDASVKVSELDILADGMFSKGYKQNFITWKTGTVGISISGDEHLASFRFGYKSDAVRDWIYEQNR